MDIHLQRVDATDTRTIGKLSLHGVLEAFTMEPPLLSLNALEDHPAIPAGTYRLDITRSVRLGRMLPLVCDVPGRSGIRIHPFNTGDESLGCIALGISRAHDSIVSARLAQSNFQPKLAAALANHEDCWITIMDPA